MIRCLSVCQGSAGAVKPSSSASRATMAGPFWPSEASVPAAPPNCTASRVAAILSRSRRASSIVVSQPAAAARR